MRALWLGCVGYDDALELQRELAALRLEGADDDTLLLLEHPPTITLGRSAQPAHVLANRDRLRALGVQLRKSDRGGDVTYHGPGQLVGYPICDLNRLGRDVHAYLRRLEGALIEAVGGFGVTARRLPPHTGVWVGDDKMAAIGVRISRWVTSHGFALNVMPDMTHFGLIVPCGIRDYGVTSLSLALGRGVEVAEALGPVARAFTREFGEPPAAKAAAFVGLSEGSRSLMAGAIDVADAAERGARRHGLAEKRSEDAGSP
jgi:lipoyl(octanoyl) transferase